MPWRDVVHRIEHALFITLFNMTISVDDDTNCCGCRAICALLDNFFWCDLYVVYTKNNSTIYVDTAISLFYVTLNNNVYTWSSRSRAGLTHPRCWRWIPSMLLSIVRGCVHRTNGPFHLLLLRVKAPWLSSKWGAHTWFAFRHYLIWATSRVDSSSTMKRNSTPFSETNYQNGTSTVAFILCGK